MLKVLLDARKINDGGIGTYLRTLIHAFESFTDIELSLLVQTKQSDLPDRFKQIQVNSKPYSLAEYFSLGLEINREKYDLFHSPHFTLPFFLKCKSVVTVHDTIHLSAPEKWYYPIISKVLIGSAVSRAAKVILVSQASKTDLFHHFPNFSANPQKFTVIENAVSDQFVHTALSLDNDQLKLEDDFILSVVSQNKPHKGLSDLLEAYSEVRKRQPLPELVLVGYGVQRFMEARPDLAQQYQGIRFLGIQEPQTIKGLYAKARALIVPSKIEGFGLTVLEAKVTGCRVMTRPLPSVIEMLDSQDHVLKDMSIDSLKEGLSVIENNFPQQINSLNAGIADRYCQQNLGVRTLELYHQALR